MKKIAISFIMLSSKLASADTEEVALLLFLLTYLFLICYLKKCDSSLYS